MTDDLERRLQRADPARSTDLHVSSAPSIRDLMEATMQNTTTQDTPRLSRKWLPAVAAAAAAVALGGVAGVAMLTDDPAPPLSASPTPEAPMELALPDPNMMSSCIEYSVDFLAQMPVAFSGEVLEADTDSVVIEVDTWYRGGDAPLVELANQSGEMTSIDGIELATGNRYLVTASDGVVSTCGFTAEWSPGMAADFEQAFGK